MKFSDIALLSLIAFTNADVDCGCFGEDAGPDNAKVITGEDGDENQSEKVCVQTCTKWGCSTVCTDKKEEDNKEDDKEDEEEEKEEESEKTEEEEEEAEKEEEEKEEEEDKEEEDKEEEEEDKEDEEEEEKQTCESVRFKGRSIPEIVSWMWKYIRVC